MSLLDPKWRYTPSTATDIRKLFAKVRRELEAQKKKAAGPNVVPMTKRKP